MKKISFLLVIMILTFSFISVYAEEIEYDPLKRNLIFVEGNAELIVPVNQFKISLGFDIQSDTFTQASRESTRIINAITEKVNALGLDNVEIIKGWDILKQAKVSFGTSGRKIWNKLIIKVTDYPKDRLHYIMASIIDSSLEIDKNIYMNSVEVSLSDDVEKVKKEETLIKALEKLRSNADKSAETQGVKIVAPKRIFVTNNQQLREEVNSEYKYDSAVLSGMARKVSFSVQKGFTVRSQITDHVKITANVTGLYEVE